MKKVIIWLLAASLCIMSGCGKDNKEVSGIAEKSNEAASVESAKSETETSSEAAIIESETEAPSEVTVIETAAYPVENYSCAVAVPLGFSQRSENAVSGMMHFDLPDGNGELISLNIFDALDESEFDNFDEKYMYLYAEGSMSDPKEQGCREVTLSNADGVSVKAFLGEYTGEYEGVESQLHMLAVNCPEQEYMALFSLLDTDGRWVSFGRDLQNYFYINENGYILENNSLTEAPEPENLEYTSEKLSFSISLPKEWHFVDGNELPDNFSTTLSGFDTYEVFMTNDGDTIIAGTSEGTTDELFYATVENQEKWLGAGGNELVSTKTCTISNYAAYQFVLSRSVASIDLRTTAWLINRPDHSDMLTISLYDLSGKTDSLASELMDNITFN